MSVSKTSYFGLGSQATPSTLVDLSAKLNKIGFPSSVDEEESTTFGTSGSKSYEIGLIGRTIPIEGNWDTTIDAQLWALLGSNAVNFEYGPVNNTASSSNPKYTGSCILTDYQPPSEVGQLAKFTATLRVTGAVTRGAY